MKEEAHGRKGSGKKGGKGQDKGGKGENRTCWTCGKTGHIAAWCGKGGRENLYAVDEEENEGIEEHSNRSTKSEEDLQAWCILEESDSEQWQEVISRRSRAKKTNQASLLSVENSHDLSPKKIVEEKDKWVKVRVTMDSGAAGHVMPETMFPQVETERKTPPNKFVAANGEQIKDLGAKRITQQDIGRVRSHDWMPLAAMQSRTTKERKHTQIDAGSELKKASEILRMEQKDWIGGTK